MTHDKMQNILWTVDTRTISSGEIGSIHSSLYCVEDNVLHDQQDSKHLKVKLKYSEIAGWASEMECNQEHFCSSEQFWGYCS